MPVTYRVSPPISSDTLNHLFAELWAQHEPRDFAPVLSRSLVYLAAYDGQRLIGFVNVAWDGGMHAFLLDTTVLPDLRRSGIGTELVRRAVAAARERGIVWLHVDFEPHLSAFYRGCGFADTEAGLMRLRD